MNQVAVIQFPGSNCERETHLALERAGLISIDFLWNENKKLEPFDAYIIIGGFSYEDRGRAGLIASLDPLLKQLTIEAQKGKPILGICNGAQILVESGLVPGLSNQTLGMALTTNKRIQDGHVLGTGYYNTWVHMKPRDTKGIFTQNLSSTNPLYLPIAHAEGRFIIPQALLTKLYEQGATVFQYCDPQGMIHSDFPTNPNGSIDNIAAISNPEGNILAMMPHPERTSLCDGIFTSLRDHLSKSKPIKTKPISFKSANHQIKVYSSNPSQQELFIDYVITDNTSLSLQTALKAKGLNVQLKRLTHWELTSKEPSEDNLNKIIQSYELFNPNKEFICEKPENKENCFYFLLQEKDDIIGQQKCEMLKQHFNCYDLQTIRHGILWQIDYKPEQKEEVYHTLINQHVLLNPYAHNCYVYE